MAKTKRHYRNLAKGRVGRKYDGGNHAKPPYVHILYQPSLDIVQRGNVNAAVRLLRQSGLTVRLKKDPNNQDKSKRKE